MKKRIITLSIIICLLATATVAYAANTATVNAAISGLKMYFGGKQLKGDVLTAKGVKYVPMNVLSSDLGFKLSSDSKTKKLIITEKVSKDKLLKDIASLQSEKKSLQSDITNLKEHIDDLNKKLRFYSGGIEDYTNQSDTDYFKSLANATSIGSAVWPLKKNHFVKTPRDSKADTWYKVDLNEGEGITVALRPQIDKKYMYLYIYGEDGKQLSDSGSVYNDEYGKVGYKASKKTTIYVRIEGESGIYYLGFYDQYFNSASAMNDERDFFGSLKTAKKIVSGIMVRDDENLEDWYRIDVKEGQTITVSISPQIDRKSMYIYIYDAEGSKLRYSGSVYDGETGTVSQKASRDGTYFIRVEGTTGKYNLSYNIR